MMYELAKWNEYDYSKLNIIKTVTRNSRKGSERFNNAFIMLDTETSKKTHEGIEANHVVAFTVSVRYKHENICTLYGNRPTELIKTLNHMMVNMPGEHTIIYVHNLAYDYMFIRKYLFAAYGTPVKALNTKPHYPIRIEFKCDDHILILRDSLILAQKKLEKWAIDMNVEHKKATGKWDYDQIRHQDHDFTPDELEYIEHDTLAGVECLDALAELLHHRIYAIPYTATGIEREACRNIGAKYHAHDNFEKVTPDFNVYQKLEMCFHGGYVHANRYLISDLIDYQVRCYDFKSSYPYVMLTEKYPVNRFHKYKPHCTPAEIIKNSERYGFITKLIMIKPRLKDNFKIMPILQASKCTKTINAVFDNGRILCAGYAEIYVTEITLKLILEQYEFDKVICMDTYFSKKDYLPKWFTDHVFQLFIDKCKLDGVDPLNYVLAKGKLNSTYGMCVQKAIQDDIEELYHMDEFKINCKYNEEEYEKYRKTRNRFLPFQWGVWVTEYAMQNLFHLGSMCDTWIYSDTDSVFGAGWHEDLLKEYNEGCLQKLKANGYDSVEVNGKVFTLGVAELDKICTEFKTMGAKRYCYRSAKDNELHITVAGVPKKGSECLKNNINNFAKGMVFSGSVTGKKTHTYLYVDEPYIDEYGNETADSIDLSLCDYLLDDIEAVDWMRIFDEEISIQVYDEV